MNTYIASLAANLVTEFCSIRAYCKLLNIRSWRQFAFLHFVLFICAFLLQTTNGHPVPRVIISVVLSPLLCFWFSKRTWKAILARIMLLNAGMAIGEAQCMLLSLLLGGVTHPSFSDAASATPTVITFLFVTPTVIVVTEAIIVFCSHMDREPDASFGWPTLVLMFVSYALFVLTGSLTFDNSEAGLTITLLALAYTCICIGLGLAIHLIARRESRARRNLVNLTAMARQAKHAKSEIAASTDRTLNVRRLRHDLANQVEIVNHMAQQGRLCDADKYLATLQSQAHSLAGASHEQ